ncbi:DUF885 domain-containing protein [Endozoicomonas arenosclerae]|uniref:DUF885 domain-containing protein n=1 Tax=Endozoicomonas arenosclerae TaxID=1633495 RepID=UPI000781BAEA|nr:DUF885 domain-containing protein [Endozoicomonas arenosclerae]
MQKTKTLLAIAVTMVMATGCSTLQTPETSSTHGKTAHSDIEQQALSESEKANQLFDELFLERAMQSPNFQTMLGIKKDQDKWDDISETGNEQFHQLNIEQLKRIQSSINPDALDPQTLLSYRLAVSSLENEIADYQWRLYNYPVNQMFGVHAQMPALLINQHQVTDKADAEAYIARLKAVTTYFDQLIDGLNVRAGKGILAPRFVYPHVIRDSKNILKGAPFEQGEAGTLLADFTRKVSALDLPKEEKQQLLAEAEKALVNHVRPAYEKLIVTLEKLESQSDDKDGVWKLPDGDAYYLNALNRTTTTELSADEIHELGLSEVARIQDEMRVIMKQVGFEDDLQAFYEFMRSDPQFYKPETEMGRQQYLNENIKFIADMNASLDQMFLTKPKARLQVKRVEAFREKSAGKAFYQRPSPDGSRPGMYYANLFQMKEMPTYQMEALAYHEGIPGHHMQQAISQELEDVPMFRKFGRYTAYIEGWGLYAEYIPKEMGFYQDPYSDFGRLAMEIWRACRLVVDTGIHSKRWTREQAIEYLALNTPNPRRDIEKAIERYIVMPSQATAYKVGMLKILKMREDAKKILGSEFDIREYHDVILKNGPLPLDVLQEQVSLWVTEKRG